MSVSNHKVVTHAYTWAVRGSKSHQKKTNTGIESPAPPCCLFKTSCKVVVCVCDPLSLFVHRTGFC